MQALDSRHPEARCLHEAGNRGAASPPELCTHLSSGWSPRPHPEAECLYDAGDLVAIRSSASCEHPASYHEAGNFRIGHG